MPPGRGPRPGCPLGTAERPGGGMQIQVKRRVTAGPDRSSQASLREPFADGCVFFDPAIFAGAFAQDLLPAQAAFLAASQTPPAGAAFATPVSNAAWKNRRSWYVLSTQDRIIPPAAQRQRAARAKAAVTEVPASHAVYISQPDAVANAIDAAAKAAAQ